MAIIKQVMPKTVFMGKLNHGGDLLEEITALCLRENIGLGRVSALGAVQKARLGFYDQQAREYRFILLDQPLEITNLIGNVSLKDNNPFVHAHVTLADKEGHVFGGHLAPGTVVFAGEIILEAYDGPCFSRSLDETTGLPLWAMADMS